MPYPSTAYNSRTHDFACKSSPLETTATEESAKQQYSSPIAKAVCASPWFKALDWTGEISIRIATALGCPVPNPTPTKKRSGKSIQKLEASESLQAVSTSQGQNREDTQTSQGTPALARLSRATMGKP